MATDEPRRPARAEPNPPQPPDDHAGSGLTDLDLDEAHGLQLDDPHPAQLARQGLQEALDLRDGGGPAAAARAETLDPVGVLLAIFTSAPDGRDR